MKWVVLVTFFNAQGIIHIAEEPVPGTGDRAWCDIQRKSSHIVLDRRLAKANMKGVSYVTTCKEASE